MELTTKQAAGLKIAVDRYKNKEKYTVIAGYAGTGKSTLVRFIVDALDIDEEDVCYATFTGKAAQVLQKKGNKNVSTLHKLLFDHFPKPTGGFYRKKRDFIEYKVVVVDEVSMAPKSLMDLLFKHNVYVICLGDPFQLPPIDKNEDNHLLDNPHIFLDEIMRQAAESEIIRLTMDIREGKPLSYQQGNEVIIVPSAQLNTGMLTWADQILCAKNVTRTSLNSQMRDLLGHSGDPETGDKVICLRNYWNILDDDGNPLVNGTIGSLNAPFVNGVKLPKYLGGISFEGLNSSFITDTDAKFYGLFLDKKQIVEGNPSLDWKTTYQMNQSEQWSQFVPLEFTYGYAITCHKAQGSEWDKVLVVEENFPFDREEHARWLYTAATRASDKLVLVRS